MTLVFSAAQALLTAEAGATYVSCFMGRLDDISVDSEAVLAEIVEALGPNREAQVLAASHAEPDARGDRGEARLRGRDDPGQGAEGDAGPPAHRVGHRAFADDWKSRPEFGEWLRGLVDESAAADSALARRAR